MTRSVYLNAGLAGVTLALPLYLWSTLYPATEWSLLAIVPLAVMLFIGSWTPAVALKRAWFLAALQPESSLSKILTGRIYAFTYSVIFIAIAIPILTWQALTAAREEILGLAALFLAASSLSLWMQPWLQHHFQQPFSCSAGITFGAWIAAIVFIPVIAWINWNFVYHPGYLQTSSLDEAIRQAMKELPPRRGWTAEVLAPLYAIEATKLWMVVQLGPSRWVTILYSLDTAFIGFIVAKTSTLLTNFVQIFNRRNHIDDT